jgi:mRNA interferase HigB
MIKTVYASARIVNSETVVFNIGGNKYRLVVKVWWAGATVWIKFVGTNKACDSVDVAKL